jgi:hypothetical protein
LIFQFSAWWVEAVHRKIKDAEAAWLNPELIPLTEPVEPIRITVAQIVVMHAEDLACVLDRLYDSENKARDLCP